VNNLGRFRVALQKPDREILRDFEIKRWPINGFRLDIREGHVAPGFGGGAN
jgi:hypothetical protein